MYRRFCRYYYVCLNFSIVPNYRCIRDIAFDELFKFTLFDLKYIYENFITHSNSVVSLEY